MKLFLILIVLLPISLSGCASSNVSKEANDNVVVGYHNTASSIENMGNGSIADSYQNTNQATKGAIIGGAAGAVAGGMTAGVGVVPGLAGGAIIGGAYGAYIDSNASLEDQLQNRGVKVMILGDQIKLAMRSSYVFNGFTAEIRPGAYSTLDLITAFLNQYTTMTVQVAAYTNATGSPRIVRAITREQANNVVRYLWRSGINTRMVTGAGMGGSHLVTENSTDLEQGWNYRLEITAEKLPTVGTLG